MKNLAVCGIVLALAALAPSLQAGSYSAAAWGLGTLLLLAFVGQHAARMLGLPALTGWLVAGFALGAGGLEFVVPPANQTLLTLRTMALLWLTFQVGLGGPPRWSHSARLTILLVAGTLLTQLLVTVALTVSSDFRLDQAIVLGAFACLWGPIVLASLSESDQLRELSVKGAAVSLVLVALTLILFPVHEGGVEYAYHFTSMLLISCVAGALSAELLWRLGILSHRRSAILGMMGLFCIVAVLVQPLGLYALPFGLCAGLVVSHRQGEGRLVSRLFDSGRPFSAMVFFVMAAASVGTHSDLWPLERGLLQFVLVQVVILIALRGVAPTLWLASHIESDHDRRCSWLLIPKGVLLFELVHGSGIRVPQLVDESLSRFLYQLVVADLLVYAIGFPVVASLLQRLLPSHRQVEAEPE